VPTTAVIIDPIRREEFSASKGSGSDLNNGKIRVSKQQV
jgi:fructose-1,6-bisphosphatase/inositol monophosphatase family enzyme